MRHEVLKSSALGQCSLVTPLRCALIICARRASRARNARNALTAVFLCEYGIKKCENTTKLLEMNSYARICAQLVILIGCVVSTLEQRHLRISDLWICIFHLLPLSRRCAVDAFSSQSLVRGGCSIGSLSHVTRFLEYRNEREHTVPYSTTVRVLLVTGVNSIP